MKFVQSFWSKPFLDISKEHNMNFRHHGGFRSTFLFLCAWTYSCLSIKKYHSNLHIVTDDFGIDLLKYKLRLPYVTFSNALNDLDDYHSGLWALGKLYTYQLQTTPFCHLDGDVFLFGSLPDTLLKESFFCQSFDQNQEQYKEIHPYVHKHFTNVPPAFNADLSDDIKLINAGIIGGHSVDLFQRYTQNVFEFVDHNQDKLDTINSGLLNLYYEQFLISNMIAQNDISFSSLYPESDSIAHYDFGAFHHIPLKSKYVHLISTLKKNTRLIEQLVARLQLEYPEYYKQLTQLF